MKLIYFPNLFLLLAAFFILTTSGEDQLGDVYEDGYYEDGYEDGSVSVEVAADSATVKTEPFFGFHKNVGGGVVKIAKMLATETYLNDTVIMYDCVKRIDANILAVEEIEEVEEEPEITKQVNELRRKMEEVAVMAGHIANGTLAADMNATSNATLTKEKKKEKKISFREKQEEKMKIRREKELQKEQLRPKFRLGADCESLVCASCKAVVEEFGRAAHSVLHDGKFRYVEDVTAGFCKSKGVALKYVDMVGDICLNFEQVR